MDIVSFRINKLNETINKATVSKIGSYTAVLQYDVSDS